MFDTLYFYAAIAGCTVLAFQLVLMMLGWVDGGDGLPDGAGDVDMDSGEPGPGWAEAGDADLGHPDGHWFYEVLSLRTLGAGVAFFGLSGRTARAFGLEDWTALLVALAVGYAGLYLVYWLFRQVYKLQQAGNENVRLAIGLPATVYVPIPGDRNGTGKVMFRLQDRTVEYQAVTDEPDRLATGEKVVVREVVSSDTVCVSRASQPVQV